ncbi:MAG: acyltransferase [Bacteroidales bacterium]|jgi:acetyltransferase-like isoleucine patch superfamily enzyme
MAFKNIKELVRRLYYLRYYAKFKGEARNVMLSPGGNIKNPEEITFGENVFIGRSFIISANNLSFGSNIMIGPNLLIECSNHNYTHMGKTMFSYSSEKSYKGISIEDDVWIGGNVVILDGVTIGEGCVIGASSVVTRSTPPYTICVGNPCRPIRKRFDDAELKEHLSIVKSKYEYDYIIKTRNQVIQI